MFAFAGTKRRHAHASSGGPLDPADHAAVRHVGIDDVESLARAVEHPGDLVGDGTELPRRVVEDDRRYPLAVLQRRKQGVQLSRRDLAAKPAVTGDEDELELRDDRPGHAHEEVVEAPVLEVVFDAGAADPPDAAVDDHDLAVIDVTQAGEIPFQLPVAPERPEGRAHLRRPNDADRYSRAR